MPQVGTRQCLARARGQCGERWTRAGMAMSRPAATLGRMFFRPVVDTWRAEVPGSLCKAHGWFSRTESKALSSGENLASLTSRAKRQEVPLPACCPPRAREMSKCTSSGWSS